MKVIFIIPSLGRQSLITTIQSLINLNNNNQDWKALIIFDGIKNNLENEYIQTINKYQQFLFLEIEKSGIEIQLNQQQQKQQQQKQQQYENNCAGYVRNYGINYLISHQIQSEYIAFLDDDDTIHPDYLHYLSKEETNYNFDVIIFRMMYKNFNIIPHLLTRKIEKKNVGISFALKYELCVNHQNVRFSNHSFEDFIFIFTLQNLKKKILISKYIAYFVQTNYNQCINYIKTYIKNIPHVKIN